MKPNVRPMGPSMAPVRKAWTRLGWVTAAMLAGSTLACGGESGNGPPTGPEPPGPGPSPPVTDTRPDLDCGAPDYPCSLSDVDLPVLERSDALGDEILLMLDAGSTVAEAFEWIRGQEGVVEAEASDDALRFRLEGGRPTWVLSEDALADVPPGAPPALVPSAGPAIRPDVVGTDPEVKKALVVSPYIYDFGAWDDGRAVAKILERTRGYRGNVKVVSIRRPGNGSDVWDLLDSFFDWNDYQVVHLSTHGTQICRDGSCQTVILGGRVDSVPELRSEGGILDLVKIEKNERDLGVPTDFFRDAYPVGLDDTIVFMSACQTFKGEDLALHLAGKGGAYLGWSEIVDNDAAHRAAVAFYQYLSETGLPAKSGYGHVGDEGLDVDSDGAKLEIKSAPGTDLRIREIVTLLHPLVKGPILSEYPVPVVGVPGDGEPDRIPFVVDIEGVKPGEEWDTVLEIYVNGIGADWTWTAAEGVQIGPHTWRVRDIAPLTRDIPRGKLDIEGRVLLPEGGRSLQLRTPEVDNPFLFLTSVYTARAPSGPMIRIEGEAEIPLRMREDFTFEGVEGEEDVSNDMDFSGFPPGCNPRVTDPGRSRLLVERVRLAFDRGGVVWIGDAMVLPESVRPVGLSHDCPGNPFIDPFAGSPDHWWVLVFIAFNHDAWQPPDGYLFDAWSPISSRILGRMEFDRDQISGVWHETAEYEIGYR